MPGEATKPVISPPPTHEEIASRISTHREAVTRELARLEEMGLIAKESRVLRIKEHYLERHFIACSSRRSHRSNRHKCSTPHSPISRKTMR